MSDSDRKSMDDVLASIRRIVRSDRPDPGSDAFDDAAAGSSDEPLLLTPDMRTDGGGEAGAAPLGDYAEAAAASPEAEGPPPAPDPLHAMIRAVLIEELGGETARDAVRAIIRDELVNGEIGGNLSQNVVRLVRDEVTRLTAER